jgi:hypothetical protein
MAALFAALTLLPGWHVLSLGRCGGHDGCCRTAAETAGAADARPSLLGDEQPADSCWICDGLASLSLPDVPAGAEAGVSRPIAPAYTAHAPQAPAHHRVDLANRSQAPPRAA